MTNPDDYGQALRQARKVLEDAGWRFDPMNIAFAYHKESDQHVEQLSWESRDAFYARLHRYTPKPPPPVFEPTQTQLFWKEAMEGLLQRISQQEVDMAALKEAFVEAQRQFREASLWDLSLYTHLNHLGHTKLDAVPWSVVQGYIDDPKYLITDQNWSGEDVWKVFFYKGTKRKPHQECVGTAVRVGWQKLEILKP